jgi:hypothetical protein
MNSLSCNLRYLVQGVKEQNMTKKSARLTFGKPLTMVAANQFSGQACQKEIV